jgi:hypothetical protein
MKDSNSISNTTSNNALSGRPAGGVGVGEGQADCDVHVAKQRNMHCLVGSTNSCLDIITAISSFD